MSSTEAWFLLAGGAAVTGALLLTLIVCIVRWRWRGSRLRGRVALLLLVAAAASGWIGYAGAKGWHNDARSVPAGTVHVWAQPLAIPPLRNLYRVSPVLLRAAQPDAAGMRALAASGVKTIVNLRTFDGDSKEAKNAGLRAVHIPARSSAINEEEVAAFLRVLSEPANLPVLVHCRHGSDRTGTMCAFYRILVEGWTREEAIEELTLGGFGYHYVYDRSIPPFILNADLARIRSLAGMR